MKLLGKFIAILLFVIVSVTAFYHLAPGSTATLLLFLQRKSFGLERKEIVLDNGLKYVYLEGGKGETVLLIHGFGGMKYNYTEMASHMTKKHHLIIPDHIGNGESSHPPDADYSPAAQAQRLHDFMAKQGITQFHLFGHSMGGQIAIHYAVMFPKDIISLGIATTAGFTQIPSTPYMLAAHESLRNRVRTSSLEEYLAIIKPMFFHKPFLPMPVLKMAAESYIANMDINLKMFAEIEKNPVDNLVGKIRTPTLLVWGENDEVFNVQAAEALRKFIPASRLVILPETGHLSIMERPQEIARQYMEFLDTL